MGREVMEFGEFGVGDRTSTHEIRIANDPDGSLGRERRNPVHPVNLDNPSKTRSAVFWTGLQAFSRLQDYAGPGLERGEKAKIIWEGGTKID